MRDAQRDVVAVHGDEESEESEGVYRLRNLLAAAIRPEEANRIPTIAWIILRLHGRRPWPFSRLGECVTAWT